ncbi:MAG: hypothetical protein GXO79_02445 [Chlorobi bacterium]|nr:hypothetical protein [Chlorobiota bacterium]
MLNSALDGKPENVEFEKDSIFELQVPKTCPDIPTEIL